MTLEDLIAKFPPHTAYSITGHIPIEFFLAHEPEIRAAIKPGRVVYRGPRTGRAYSTPRAQARFAMIYDACARAYPKHELVIAPLGDDEPFDEFFNLPEDDEDEA